MIDFAKRRGRVRQRLRKEGMAGLLVTNAVNVRYLTGFTGDDSYLLLTRDHDLLLSDARYEEQITGECPGLEGVIRRPPVSLMEIVTQVVSQAKLGNLALEADHVTLGLFRQLADELSGVELVEIQGWIQQLREIKDRHEVGAIRRAIQVAERAFLVVRAGLRSAQTERALAAELEYQIRGFDGEGFSFPPIVAAGARAALPHARPDKRHYRGQSDLVLFDWGAVVEGYRSDLTRVVTHG
jgi:Xaa-Pro aminopeptidase